VKHENINVYFSDIFKVSEESIEDYGALNISLINDMPMFIDPFLLFNSEKPEYQLLHNKIIRYVCFLRDEAVKPEYDIDAKLKSLYAFSEIKQNWLGFSLSGNKGRALGITFAKDLYKNLSTIFKDFDASEITKSPHLEKLCLISKDVGKDKISDFTVNLIKHYLLEYTERFAQKYISDDMCSNFSINRTEFNYKTISWLTKSYYLPCFNGDYVILTPKDMLTKDDTFINQTDMLDSLHGIASSIDNDSLRYKINNYFLSILEQKKDKRELTKEEKREASASMIRENPEIIDYYIKSKEERGKEATRLSEIAVQETEDIFINSTQQLINILSNNTDFYTKPTRNTYEEAIEGLKFLKHVIEDCDGYRLFYHKDQPINRENIGQIMFRLIWHGAKYSIDSEVNNGRGPADYIISFGADDKTIVEFKLASNTKLKHNLAKQVEIYKKANNTDKSVKAIIYFTEAQHKKTMDIINELNLTGKEDIILIDARRDNKLSASNLRIGGE